MGESGRYAAVKLGTDLIRGIGKWDLTMDAKEADDTEFGDGWERTDVATMGWKGSFSGLVRPDDPFQQALNTYFLSGALIPDIRFYLNSTVYFAPDVAANADAGGRVKSQKYGQDKDKNATVAYEIVGSGPVNRFGG
jgi:hypothetical protein